MWKDRRGDIIAWPDIYPAAGETEKNPELWLSSGKKRIATMVRLELR